MAGVGGLFTLFFLRLRFAIAGLPAFLRPQQLQHPRQAPTGQPDRGPPASAAWCSPYLRKRSHCLPRRVCVRVCLRRRPPPRPSLSLSPFITTSSPPGTSPPPSPPQPPSRPFSPLPPHHLHHHHHHASPRLLVALTLCNPPRRLLDPRLLPVPPDLSSCWCACFPPYQVARSARLLPSTSSSQRLNCWLLLFLHSFAPCSSPRNPF